MRLNLTETLLTVSTRKVCGRPKWLSAASRTILKTSSSGSASKAAAAAGGRGDMQRHVDQRDSTGLQGSPKDSKGLQGTPRDSKGLQGTPRDSKGLQGSPRDSKGLQETQRDSKGLQGTPRDSKGLQSRESPRTPRFLFFSVAHISSASASLSKHRTGRRACKGVRARSELTRTLSLSRHHVSSSALAVFAYTL